MKIFNSKTLRTGLLALSIAIMPAATSVIAQSGGGTGGTTSGSGSTTSSTRSDSSGMDWGWLGLLGLAGLLGLMPKKRTATDSDYAGTGTRTAATR
jgi:uncharacterized membrane protein